MKALGKAGAPGAGLALEVQQRAVPQGWKCSWLGQASGSDRDTNLGFNLFIETLKHIVFANASLSP